MNKPGRIYYTDAMRSVLMLLGVVAHSSYVFTVSGDWLVANADTSMVFDGIAGFLLMFRMPAFFLVSGFFCHMTLTRYGAKRFLNVRLTRIVVPLVVTGVFVNGLQNYLLDRYYGERQGAVSLFLNWDYWLDGAWVAHLWFLNCLVVYFLLAGAVYALLRRPLSVLADGVRLPSGFVGSGAYVLLLPAILVAVDFVGYRVPDVITDAVPFLSFYELLHNGVFFVFGFLLGAYAVLMDDFPRPRVWGIALLLGFTIVKIFFPPSEELGMKTLHHYGDAYISWYLCVLCFYLFRKYFDAPSRTFSYLSDASYSIYLFHHFWVVALAIAIVPLTLNLYIKFGVIVLASAAISFALHHFAVLRSPSLRYLFNGKTPADTKKAQAEAHKPLRT